MRLHRLRDERFGGPDGVGGKPARAARPDGGEPQGELEITTNKCLGGVPHQEDSPVVAVEGKVFKKADAETVMAYIVDCVRENEQ